MQVRQATVACSVKQNWLEQVAITLSYISSFRIRDCSVLTLLYLFGLCTKFIFANFGLVRKSKSYLPYSNVSWTVESTVFNERYIYFAIFVTDKTQIFLMPAIIYATSAYVMRKC